MIIGITGSSGSGKGTVSKIFCENGFTHIDTDLYAKEATKQGSACVLEIKKSFPTVVDEHNILNRKALAEIVFQSPQKLALLNAITHKYIEELVLADLHTIQGNIIIDGAALLESKIVQKCEKIIAVVSDEELRVQRIMERDMLCRRAALLRIQGQKSDEYYTKNADFVIENNNDVDKLRQVVLNILNTIKGEQ